jgi:hypothetical protein
LRSTNAQRRGWDRCPSKSVSAASIESVVLSQIEALVANPERIRAMIAGLATEDERAEDGSDAADPAVPVARDSARRAAADDLPTEQKADVLRGLVEQVNYDGANGKIAITFRPAGLHSLANAENQP